MYPVRTFRRGPESLLTVLARFDEAVQRRNNLLVHTPAGFVVGCHHSSSCVRGCTASSAANSATCSAADATRKRARRRRPIVAGQARRVGFMAGQIDVPDDFDRMGSSEIEQLFSSR